MNNLSKMRVNGRMLKFIHNYLNERTIKVKIGNTFSRNHTKTPAQRNYPILQLPHTASTPHRNTPTMQLLHKATLHTATPLHHISPNQNSPHCNSCTLQFPTITPPHCNSPTPQFPHSNTLTPHPPHTATSPQPNYYTATITQHPPQSPTPPYYNPPKPQPRAPKPAHTATPTHCNSLTQ